VPDLLRSALNGDRKMGDSVALKKKGGTGEIMGDATRSNGGSHKPTGLRGAILFTDVGERRTSSVDSL